MKTIAVIPARYASTRMPGKPLADVLGKPMIYWVYQAAKACPKLDDVLIATDDERIADACKAYDMRCLMTSPDHDTPTGRIWEVSTVEDADLYLQLMGDEPLVNPRQIHADVVQHQPHLAAFNQPPDVLALHFHVIRAVDETGYDEFAAGVSAPCVRKQLVDQNLRLRRLQHRD